MNIQAEKIQIIEQFREINDIELIRAVKLLLNYGLKKEKELSVYNIPEEHKQLVRDRIKNTKPENMLNWDDVKDNFRL
ncbi:MAG: hypothetical protein A2275_09965 [Bacteroidetes bacterium RIFOXYA12_FULL_35_11]|nr:MAG: hypothetical protein A2X01_09880 [Bacteroidetes bacterium GWF2_35_48]OFY83225.1 MAG: hypothetical protein A2275_09965 [Bacteroidetes bacterium RIFOXYA12_FULL_35_11]OFY94459.1 MAG: hypothetical protein A2309_08860 [Bacteroidetes bacterium RIFOXYB2_FULL_35_7]OFY97925.1 MAG: hypothetical protein A2491_18235 [Bacteroidetes bacterium RIFOXYC12_FULL_35_7]HBX51626.1 hypothetical protein [Bacteroidales bacterium]